MNEIIETYNTIKDSIKNQMEVFKKIGESNNINNIFEELCFCLLTPQSKARMAFKVINNLKENNLLYNGNLEDENFINSFNLVRFKNNKAKFLIELRNKIFVEKFPIFDIINMNNFEAREILVDNIKGFGFKEATHFLRNIGKGKNLAILDRHILKNMLLYKVIDNIPKTISKNKYYELEQKYLSFSLSIGIDPVELDFVFWFLVNDEIFK